MPTTTAGVDQAAERLLDAADTGTPCAPVRDLIGPDDVAAAYAVQRRLTARRTAAGARTVGRKIGLTNPTVQAQLGVASPDFGVLFDDMPVEHDGTVAAGRLLQPRIEAEVAFVLGADLDGPDLTDADVRAAVDHQRAALEIVDSRIAGWDITFGDTVADNGSSGLYVLGPEQVGLDRTNPVDVTMTLRRGEETVSSGAGEACLGHPLAALAWLARTARDLGEPLRAGEVVLSGALGPMVPVTPGDAYSAHITGLGDVAVTFAKETP
ncbi:fumarylacetoacetate hydrolase family protein [Actinomycetospora sp. NBRC 106375]|uniref:2-keto-4-pentenoate hydratase n=1 Tax=Actinomycetospora sp. NBRC 106375 TaxID=3032207 RepID=UPI002553E9E4|nr:fumarylacetoacetate hydrolase family protein [Actinomycetospora sp. NBRC 106375]